MKSRPFVACLAWVMLHRDGREIYRFLCRWVILVPNLGPVPPLGTGLSRGSPSLGPVPPVGTGLSLGLPRRMGLEVRPSAYRLGDPGLKPGSRAPMEPELLLKVGVELFLLGLARATDAVARPLAERLAPVADLRAPGLRSLLFGRGLKAGMMSKSTFQVVRYSLLPRKEPSEESSCQSDTDKDQVGCGCDTHIRIPLNW